MTPLQNQPDLALLRRRITGTVALPGEPGYELALPWNRAVAVNPAAVVAVTDASDIAAVLQYATEYELRVAVHATGHSAAPLGPDTILIHTGRLQDCTVDADQRTAAVGAGVLASTLLNAGAPHGLAAILGSSGSVGVIGFLSGGGIGPLAATFGLSSDYIRSIDVVTGDGMIRHVTADTEPDLFWGLRGGRGTLGITTAVELQLHSLTSVYGGALHFGADDLPAMLRLWPRWSAGLSSQATTSAAIMRLPYVPGAAPASATPATLAIRFASTHSRQHSEKLLAPLRAAAIPIMDTIADLTIPELPRIHAEPDAPMPVYRDQLLLNDLPTTAVDTILAAIHNPEFLSISAIELRRLGGELAEPIGPPSAFSHRDAAYSISVGGPAAPGQTNLTAAAQNLLTTLGPWSTGGTLANFLEPTNTTGLNAAYDPLTITRLRQLAARYDPSNTLATKPPVL